MKSHLICSLIATLALSACDNADTSANTPATPTTHPHSSILSTVPNKAEAIDVATARSRKPGEGVTVRGRLIGAGDVFAEHQTIFIIGDPAQVKPNYAKPKPHMACCTPSEIKAANIIPAQIVGEDGLPLPGTLRGLGGLKELDYVVIQGVISPDSTQQAPIINISALEKVEPWVDGDAPAAWAPSCSVE